MARDLRVFVSSVQKELKAERRGVKSFVLQDPLLSRFFSDVFLFEDLPASDRRTDDLYLEMVANCDVYVGIFGNEYGPKNARGLSPTELEFDQATVTNRERLIFVKGQDDAKRQPEMAALIRKAASQLTRRRFEDEVALTREVYASLVECLERRGRLSVTPFDSTACARATLADVDATRVREFVRLAEKEGRLRLRGKAAPKEVLQHFHLLSEGRPTNAAVLLFGREPAALGLRAEVQCLHFHDTEKRKPIASQQSVTGTLFDQVDGAVEFVLARTNRRVSNRVKSTRASVEYEVPRTAVAEAVVNAVAHRDYASHGLVQVIVFSDRVEVWNPGELPPGLTPERLREPHGPIPRNPLLAEPLFRAHYIEKAGTGTTDMIADCRGAGLPEPGFEQRGACFVVTLWRDRLTKEFVARLALNDRQEAVLAVLKARGSVSSADYQTLTGASRQTASRDLDGLVVKGVVVRRGKGRGTRYSLVGRMPRK